MRRNTRRWYALADPAAAVLVIALARLSGNQAAEAADLDRRVPTPVVDETPKAAASETLILAGGCFWGVQGVFQHVRGVLDAVSGYDGGAASTAHYEIVSTGTTVHAESVRTDVASRQSLHRDVRSSQDRRLAEGLSHGVPLRSRSGAWAGVLRS
jgi:peptide-methionine (S)-S-oxide reductase